MSDSYLSIAAIAADHAMQTRVTACAAQQAAPDPEQWAIDNRYQWAASPGWGAAWDSALAGGVPNPGADPSVVSDGMILSTVQQLLGIG